MAARSAARRLDEPPSARNATAPGPRLVLPPLPEPFAPLLDEVESPELWDRHRAALLADLRPEGAVEEMLADRIVGLSWRLQRVVRAETDALNQSRAMAGEDVACFLADPDLPEARADVLATARVRLQCREIDTLDAEIERLQRQIELREQWADWAERLFELPDDQVLPGGLALSLLDLAAGVVEERTGATPEGPRSAAFLEALGVKGFDGEDAYTGPFPARWTAARVRAGLERLFGGPVDIWPALARLSAAASLGAWEGLQGELEQAEARKSQARKAMAEHVVRLRRQRMIPETQVLKSICQAEGHLDRALHRAMAELRRWQALRARRPAAPVVVQETPAVVEAPVPPLQAVHPEDEPRVAEEVRLEPVAEAVSVDPAPVAIAGPEANEVASVPAAPEAAAPAASPAPEAATEGSREMGREVWGEPRGRGLAAPLRAPVADLPAPGPDWLSPYYSPPLTARNGRRRARERVLAAGRR